MLSSKFTLNLNGSQLAHYSSTPKSVGGMIGAQVGIRLWKIFFNPYFIYYRDFSNGCKSYETDDAFDHGTANQNPCFDASHEHDIQLAMSFSAYGLNVGLGPFYLTAYSMVIKDSSLSGINLNLYQLAYDFEL